MAIETLEERLEILEREMTQVKARLEPQDSSKANPWLTHVYGAFKNDPLFEESVRYGREWRESQNGGSDEEDNVPDGHG